LNKITRDRRALHRSGQSEKLSGQFFPPVEEFADHVNVSVDEFSGPRKVLVSLDVLRGLIGFAAAEVAFDEEFYLERYSDLRQAAEAGHIADLKTHYASHGYFERRQGCLRQSRPVDERWYLDTYPDVAKGIETGSVSSVTEHYRTTGRKEGRRPAGDLSESLAALLDALHPVETGS
jgi:hypothetical protein